MDLQPTSNHRPTAASEKPPDAQLHGNPHAFSLNLLDTFLDDDEPPQVLQAKGAPASSKGSEAMAGPPQTPNSASENAVAMNPALFAKALEMTEARQRHVTEEASRQHSTLTYGVCGLLALLCLLVLLGAAVFSGKAYEPPSIRWRPVTPSNYSDSLNETIDGRSEYFLGARVHVEEDSVSPLLTGEDATSPLQPEIFAGADNAR